MVETETDPPDTRTEELRAPRRPGLARPQLLRSDSDALRWAFGGAVAILAWLGWAALAPTFGFPTLAPAPMLNRALRVSLGSRWGWILLVTGLAVAAAAYAIAVSGKVLGPGWRSGVMFGIGAWLVIGVVVMPVLALVTPDTTLVLPRGGAIHGMATPADPEAMRPTFMMLHLGVLAPLGALIAWMLFGAVLGATGSVAASEPATETLVDVSDPTTEESMAPTRRALGALAVIVAVLVVAAGLWVATRPAEAALSCGGPFGRRVVGTIDGDVEVTTHGTVCAIRGTVTGDVIVRDTSEACTKREVLTAVHVIGGTIEGDIRADGRRCVMVWLRDDAHVGGDIAYAARGNLGFLGDGTGATVEGNVTVLGGLLWATGDSTTNRIGGDLTCVRAEPVGGAGAGSADDWDGMNDGSDGTVEGTYSGC
jgi:hypothetical protein